MQKSQDVLADNLVAREGQSYYWPFYHWERNVGSFFAKDFQPFNIFYDEVTGAICFIESWQVQSTAPNNLNSWQSISIHPKVSIIGGYFIATFTCSVSHCSLHNQDVDGMGIPTMDNDVESLQRAVAVEQSSTNFVARADSLASSIPCIVYCAVRCSKKQWANPKTTNWI